MIGDTYRADIAAAANTRQRTTGSNLPTLALVSVTSRQLVKTDFEDIGMRRRTVALKGMAGMTSTATGTATQTRATRAPVSWGFRTLAAIGVLVSAGVHLYLWKYQQYSQIPRIGPLFLLNGFGGIAIAVLLFLWRGPLILLGALGFGAASIVALFIAVKWGIPTGAFTLHEPAGGKPEIYSWISESLAVLAGAAGIAHERRRRARQG